MKVEGKFSDSELIMAVGDKTRLNEAILFIYRQYSDIVSSFIINYGASEQDADDVFQETVIAFINIVQQGKFRMEASIKTFLVSVARNIWLNELKRRKSGDQRAKVFETSRGHIENDVIENLNRREMREQLLSLMDKVIF